MNYFFYLLLFASSLFAEVKHIYPDMEFFNSKVKIVDVRTEPEWRDGVVEKSILITFFDEKGNYNMDNFLRELHKYVSKDEEFALICRSGNRSAIIGAYLDALGYKVINIKGGINYVKALKLPIVRKESSSLEESTSKH